MSSITLNGVVARAKRRDVVRSAALNNVTLSHSVNEKSALAIMGAAKDGTSLLFDVIEGWTKPKSGQALVSGGSPEAARPRIARVSLEAPLPDALRVEEVCTLAAAVRGEPRKAATERLGILGIGALAKRRVRSLSLEERRAVTLAIALSSSKIDVLLLEEPLIAIDPVTPRLVIDLLRDRALSMCIVATTASPRDAMRLGDRLGILTNGTYAALDDPNHAHVASGVASMRVVVTPAQGKAGATKLVAALTNHDGVTRVETHSARTSGAVAIIVTGRDLLTISKAVTHAVAVVRVDVELVEPITLPLDALRVALAARAASPPPGSLPPQPLPPSSLPPVPPPVSVPPSGAVPSP